MSSIDTLLQLQAAHTGHAQPRVGYRHRHITDNPFVIVTYRLSGEVVTPFAVMYGTHPDHPTLQVAAEPRNPLIRFRDLLNPFSIDLCNYLRGHNPDDPEQDIHPPQIIVANNGTADWLTMLARNLRHLTPSELVHQDTIRAGGHLTWLTNRADIAGTNTLHTCTNLLRRHWHTGLSHLETEDVHVQHAWIYPPDKMTGQQAGNWMEEQRRLGNTPAAGPSTDPLWDRDILDPLIDQFNQHRGDDDSETVVAEYGTAIRQAAHGALHPTWRTIWNILRILHITFPLEAGTVHQRWQQDRDAWTRHIERFPDSYSRRTPLAAAIEVQQRERGQAMLTATEALDDPLVMACYLADGTALQGTVIDTSNGQLVILPDQPCTMPAGTELFWTDQPNRNGQVRIDHITLDGHIVLNPNPTGTTPGVGERVIYSPHTTEWIPDPPPPAGTPWTHNTTTPTLADDDQALLR